MLKSRLVFLPGLLVLAAASGDAFAEAVPARERGAQLYGMMCSVCHGEAGQGYAADRAPALANPDFLSAASDDFLRLAIADGRAGTTMSAWSDDRGGPLSAEDMDALLAFMRGWQREPRADLDERPAEGSAARGERLFASQCARCHGARGTGGPYVNIGSPQLLRTAGNGFLRHAIRDGRRYTLMPDFGVTLAEGGVEDLLAFMRSWEAPVPAQAPPLQSPLPLGPVPLNPGGPEPAVFKAYPGMTPVDAVKAELDRGAKMAFLDARAPSDYAAEHIEGAVSVPFYDPGPYLSALPKDAWLVCYCACPHAESGQLAQKLMAAGFSKVTVLDEGLGVWKERKYGTRTGQAP